MDSQQKIEHLRAALKEQELDGVLIPKADEYQGEFVADYAERLQWLTDFTGSAGAAIVLADKACMMSDARYTLQLEQQIDTHIFEPVDSIKIGPAKWLKDNAEEGAVIGYDPWLHTPFQIQNIRNGAPHITLKALDENPVDAIWSDQPARPCGKVKHFPDELTGKSFEDKKADIAARIHDIGADAAIITLPDSISWLVNMRGSDITYIPYILSYAIIHADPDRALQWIVEPKKLEGLTYSAEIEVVELDALELLQGTIAIDFKRTPIWFQNKLEALELTIIDAKDPCIAPKAIKSAAEYTATKAAHVKDGVALTKFLHWMSNANGKTELDVDTKLKTLRAAQGCKGISFPTIAGFGPNGAIVHYRAKDGNAANIEGDGLLLVDSGGQYFDADEGIAGTTDITRTIAIGTPTDEQKHRFTLALKGHIALAMARFPKGTNGAQLDTLARNALWNDGVDFAHGTGHGVGCYLAVHEEAASISSRGQTPLEAGMLISNEPGYYKDGEYGIRIENLIFVKDSAVGQNMLEFETISLAPIDSALIVADMLSMDEKAWLNDYHTRVYETIASYLEDEEAAWLKHQTQAL